MSTKIAQGKTKAIFSVPGEPDKVRIQSLDSLTAFNAQRKNEMEGKARAASQTTCNVFKYLNSCGVPTHFVRELSETEFEAVRCEMIPIEWVARRLATGSFLKRNPGVPQGHTFTPPLVETFYKDDANDDPQWSGAQLLAAGLSGHGRTVGAAEAAWLRRATRTVFRILERAWAALGCVLVDLKVEFGVAADGRLLLADVVDNDSWRLWPGGERRLQLDKQAYRDLPQVTAEALREVKHNYERVAELSARFAQSEEVRAAVVLGSGGDADFGGRVAKTLRALGVPCEVRVCSAHKCTEEVLALLAQLEQPQRGPAVLVAVAGRSNGLGPVLAANSALPVINAPPLQPDWAPQDIWSSLHMPSGVGCSTVLGAEEAALAAAKILASHSHLVHGKVLASQLNNVQQVLDADRQLAKLDL